MSVEGCISTYWEGFWKKTKPKNETYPRSTIVRYKFPAREKMPPVKLTWWDGGMMPPRPEELEEGRRMGDSDGGVLFLGEQGQPDVRLLRPQPAADSRIQDEAVQAAGQDAGPHSGRAKADTSRIGFAPARAVSRPARTSTTPAPCRKPC